MDFLANIFRGDLFHNRAEGYHNDAYRWAASAKPGEFRRGRKKLDARGAKWIGGLGGFLSVNKGHHARGWQASNRCSIPRCERTPRLNSDTRPSCARCLAPSRPGT